MYVINILPTGQYNYLNYNEGLSLINSNSVIFCSKLQSVIAAL